VALAGEETNIDPEKESLGECGSDEGGVFEGDETLDEEPDDGLDDEGLLGSDECMAIEKGGAVGESVDDDR
jgi:hypothetical protein